jgi:hypothetical protein
MTFRLLPFLVPLVLFLDAQPVSQDPALDPAPVIVPPGPEYADATRLFQGIPGIERSRKGRLWAVWYAGGDNEGPENYVVVVTSGDGGRSWSKPKLVVDPRWLVRAYDPCLWTDPKGRLWLFWAQAAVKWDGRGGVWAIMTANPDSPDPKWSAPRRIADGVMMNKPTVARDGRWLLPVGGWRNIKPNLSPGKMFDLAPHTPESLTRTIPHRDSGVVESSDGGRTFRFLGEARVPDAQFDESMIVQRRDESLWMLVRTTYGIGQSESRDGGRTWSPGTKYLDHVVTRYFIRRLRSGRLLLVRHLPPSGKARSHLTAQLSGDEGATWGGSLSIDERNSVSYPDGVQAKDGTIYLIYDRERTKAREILMATFTEQDVAQGRGVSPKARFRVVVNKAGE